MPESFNRLLITWFASVTGDGMRFAALPLLALTLSPSPAAVAAVAAATSLPWLLIALPAGALVDRLDPAAVIAWANAGRALVVALPAVAVVSGWAGIPLLCVVGFLLTAGETFADSAGQSLLVRIIPSDRLEAANARFVGSENVGLDLIGPLAAGGLFVLGQWLPFAVSAGIFLVTAYGVLPLRGHRAADAAASPIYDSAGTTASRRTPAGQAPAGPAPADPAPAGPTPGGPITPGPMPASPTPGGPTPGAPTPGGPAPVGPMPASPTPAGATPAGPTPAGVTPAGPTRAGPTPGGLIPAGPTPGERGPAGPIPPGSLPVGSRPDVPGPGPQSVARAGSGLPDIGVAAADDGLQGQRLSVRAGFRVIFADPQLRALVITVAVMAAAIAAAEGVLVVYSAASLRLPAALYPTLLACYSVGLVLAAAAVSRWGAPLRSGAMMVGAVAVIGATLLLMGVFPHPVVAWWSFLAMGAAGGVWNVLSASRRQRRTPPSMIARVSSTFRAIAWGALPLGTAVGGWIGQTRGVTTVFVVSGVVVLVLAVVAGRFLGVGADQERNLAVPREAPTADRSGAAEPV